MNKVPYNIGESEEGQVCEKCPFREAADCTARWRRMFYAGCEDTEIVEEVDPGMRHGLDMMYDN